MPADPHQWQTNDIVSASLLNGDFYLASGQMFAPNGIRFHARRPVYKSYNANSGNNLSTGSWGKAFGNASDVGASNVIVDTPGLLGAWFDPGQSGSVNLNLLTGGGGSMGGGGLSPSNGGIMLGVGYALWPATGNTSNLGAGIGNGTTSSSAPASWGTLQPPNSAHQTSCFTVDLMDSNPGFRWCSVAFNGSTGALAPVATANADGSGAASRMHAFWASVYSNMANPPASAPAPLTNWTGQTITASLLNGSTGLRPMARFLNAPPMCRAQATSGQSLTSGVAATANLSATSGFNAWGAFSSNTFTAPVAGLYLFHGYATVGNINAPLRVGVKVNAGSVMWGPWTAAVPTSGNMSGTKTQILSLNAGDTVTMQLMANANATTVSSGSLARMCVLWLSAQGPPPATPPTIPDTTFRWAAGQQGPLDPLFNAHFANDLNFLNTRPYLLSYQTANQAISMSTPTVVTMDTVAGQVHGDAGDPWNGWSTSTHLYTAPVAGWYLAVEEVVVIQPTLTVTPSVLALFALNPHGTDSYDRFQQQTLPNTGGGGATAISIHYLRAGDTIGPAIELFDASNTTLNTNVTVNSHFELVWLAEG